MDVYVRGFILDRTSQGVTGKTIEWHLTAIKRFEVFLVESETTQEPNEWTATTLRQFIVHLQSHITKSGTPLSATSVRTYTNSVWAFCRWLFQEEVIESDISARAKKPRNPQVRKEAFSESELRGMLNTSKTSLNSHRDVAIISLLLDSGMRASEVCNLTIAEFLSGDHLILVREGKGKKDRIVPISIKSALAISKYLTKVRRSSANHEPLFLNKRGGHMTTNGLLQMIKRIAQESGVTDAHPHRFRHTFAMSFLRNGGDPFTLQRILGHTTLDMTNHYVSMLTDDLSRVHAMASPLTNLK